DELLDRPPMALQRRTHLVEVAVQQRLHRLGVCPLTERRRPRHVAEQHRRQLPPPHNRRAQRGTAEATETTPLLILPTTPSTDRHTQHPPLAVRRGSSSRVSGVSAR